MCCLKSGAGFCQQKTTQLSSYSGAENQRLKHINHVSMSRATLLGSRCGAMTKDELDITEHVLLVVNNASS